MNKSLELYERRFAAYLIDFGIALALTFIILYIPPTLPNWAFFNLAFMLPFIVYAIFNALLTFITNGKTIGGMIFRLKIVNNNYQIRKKRLSFFTCFIRAICLAVYTIVIASFLYMLVKKTTVAFFDNLSHTLVISA